MDELRISKGIARWISDFTPPSSPYGKVYTVTGTKKFGTASGEFHGSGDYLSLADSDDWNFGSGAFTIDFWVKFNKGNSASSFMGDPIEFVRLKLKGIKTKVTKSASTDADGFFEFTDLDADTYVIIAKKKGFRKNQQKVTLEEGESEEIEIVMRKSSKRIKELLLEEDVR
jgi:hypothetical protein